MWQFVKSTVQLFWFVWRTHPLTCLTIVLLTILQGLVPLANAWITKVLLDWLAQHFAEPSIITNKQLIGLLVAQATLIVIAAMLPNVSRYLNADLRRRLTVSIQSMVYQKINGFAGIAYFENPDVYDTIRLAIQGAETSSGQTVQIFTELIESLVTLLSFVGVLFSFNLFLANLVLLSAFPQFVVQLKLGQQRFGLAFQLSPEERLKYYYSLVLADAQAAKEVLLFGLGPYFLQKLLNLYQQTHQAERRQEQWELRWELGLNIISSAVASAAFIIIVFAAFNGRLTLGDITLYVSAVNSVQSSASQFVMAAAGLGEGVMFYSFFEKLLSLPPALSIPASPRPVPKLSSEIELRNVSFRYSNRHPWILQDVNLKIPVNCCLALVGLNGAGKSTLVKLLTRLYDPSIGQILWDGVDIREFDPNGLRQRMSTIFQDFMHYDLTVRENIGLSDLNRIEDMEWIQQAAQRANIHAEISRLPQAYETKLTRMFAEEQNGGIDLSGGQWQGIATARMFAREADLLILDEPTAALDAQAEYETYSHFAKLMSDRTSLLISHRFSTVRMADAIAVLEAGRIVEYGSHADLIRLNGTYARLYKMQAESYLESSPMNSSENHSKNGGCEKSDFQFKQV